MISHRNGLLATITWKTKMTAAGIAGAAVLAAVIVATAATAQSPAPTTIPVPAAAPRGDTASAAAPVVGTKPASSTSVLLPAPTGPHRVGTVSLHLIDRARTDPWVTSHPARELIAQIWYPTSRVTGYPAAPWMTPAAATHFQATFGVPNPAAITTHAHLGAPVAPHPGGWPVVLYSHGFATNRALGTTLVEDLASHGYLVVAIDHTHDASEVEFPGGRVETAAIQVPTDPAAAQTILTKAVEVRTADARFVLDQLAVINAGHNPDADNRQLPRGLCGALRLTGVGVFGHSLGGATAANLVHTDSRVSAGVNLDGFLYGPVTADGLNRPFLQIGSQTHGRDNDPSWATFADRSHGWHRELKLTGSRHMSFSDLETVVPQVAPAVGMTPQQVAALIGTVDPTRATLVERTYLTAFFDLHLRHLDRHLLDGSSPRYPEIQFIPSPTRP